MFCPFLPPFLPFCNSAIAAQKKDPATPFKDECFEFHLPSPNDAVGHPGLRFEVLEGSRAGSDSVGASLVTMGSLYAEGARAWRNAMENAEETPEAVLSLPLYHTSQGLPCIDDLSDYLSNRGEFQGSGSALSMDEAGRLLVRVKVSPPRCLGKRCCTGAVRETKGKMNGSRLLGPCLGKAEHRRPGLQAMAPLPLDDVSVTLPSSMLPGCCMQPQRFE